MFLYACLCIVLLERSVFTTGNPKHLLTHQHQNQHQRNPYNPIRTSGLIDDMKQKLIPNNVKTPDDHENEENVGFSDLPYDVYQKIFSQVHLKDLGSFSLASKGYAQIQRDYMEILKSLLQMHSNDPVTLKLILKRFENSDQIRIILHLTSKMDSSTASGVYFELLQMHSNHPDALRQILDRFKTMKEIGILSHLIDLMSQEHAMKIESMVTSIAYTAMGARDPQEFENGITRNEQGRIAHITWGNHGLQGELNPLLGSLSQLTYLILYFNRLTSIPDAIGKLGMLKYLNLKGNRITELDSLELLTTLEKLDVGDNQIKEIHAIRKLTRLRYLDLSHNQIEKLPKEFAYLVNLEELGLDFNRLAELSEIVFRHLVNLRVLWIDGTFKGHLPLTVASREANGDLEIYYSRD